MTLGIHRNSDCQRSLGLMTLSTGFITYMASGMGNMILHYELMEVSASLDHVAEDLQLSELHRVEEV